VGPRADLGGFGEQTISCHYRDETPDHSARSKSLLNFQHAAH